ncbi:hypothetical protein DH2020_021269 [Rehmannia glutinosa]|uniref:UBC core domain-containing protein n=1 Tax=Rehmannia glutinosa TaxID=99300 RepID=A0ABR0WDQ2_REHGL
MEVRNEEDVQSPPTPSKQVKSSPNPVDTNSMSGGDLGVSAFPEGDSIFTWIGTIEGGKGTMYEGLSYKLSLRFPVDYPFKPPQVKFETMCFHPNVDQYGNICLDILQSTRKWCANITWLENHLRADSRVSLQSFRPAISVAEE